MQRISVHLKTRFKNEPLFDYDFVGSPAVNDEIREDGKVYTITKRFWDGGKLCVEVTDRPATGVIKASRVDQNANVVAGTMIGMTIDSL